MNRTLTRFVFCSLVHSPLLAETLTEVEAVKSWIKMFGSASPLMTIRKTYDLPLQMSDENLARVIQGQSLLKFSQPLSDLNNKELKEFDLFALDQSRRMNAQEQNLDVQKAAYELIQSRADDELLILELELSQALDVYFGFFLRDPDKKKRDLILQRQTEIVYVSNPIEMSMPIHTKEFVEVMRAVDGVPTPNRTVKDQSLDIGTVFPSRLFYYANLKRGIFSLERLKDESLARLTTIVLMDSPNLGDSRGWDGLPRAAAVKKAGFQKVRVGIGNLSRGTELSIEDFEKTWKTPSALPLKDYERDLLRRKHPAIEKRYKEGMVINPRRKSLSSTLLHYQSEGLAVRISGMDNP